jgi:hypothetical protein
MSETATIHRRIHFCTTDRGRILKEGSKPTGVAGS